MDSFSHYSRQTSIRGFLSSLFKADLRGVVDTCRGVVDTCRGVVDTCRGEVDTCRLVLDSLSVMSKAALNWFLVPLSKTDMYWIPCSHQPNQTCIGFFFPLPKADLYWIPCPFIHGSHVLDSLLLKSKEDSLFPLPKARLYGNPCPISQGKLILDSLSHYSRQTCTGLGVPISSGRLVLDSWFPIPKESLSHKPRQTCIGFLVSLFKVDLYWIPCLIVQGRLVLGS